MQLRRSREKLKSDKELETLFIKYSAFCANLSKICVCGLQIAMAKTAEPDEKGDSGLRQYVRKTRIEKAENERLDETMLL